MTVLIAAAFIGLNASAGETCADDLTRRPPGLGLIAPEPERRLRIAAARVVADFTFPEPRAAHEVSAMRRDAGHLREFFRVVATRVPSLRTEADARRRIFDEFLASADLTERPSAEQLEELEKLFRVTRQRVALCGLIRKLRETPSALASPEVRVSLQVIVIDGIEQLIRARVARTGHALDWGGPGLYAISDLITLDMPSRQHQRADVDVASEEIWFDYSYQFMMALMFELVGNANVVTERRRGEGRALIRLVSEKDGGALLEIEDFGNPREYSEITGTGASHPDSRGAGTGRLRAYLLADFMGYALAHSIKADGSGSIVTLTIPAEHVAPKSGLIFLE